MNLIFNLYIILFALFLLLSAVAFLSVDLKQSIKSNWKPVLIFFGLYLISVLLIADFQLLKFSWIIIKDAFIGVVFLGSVLIASKRYSRLLSILLGAGLLIIWFFVIRPWQVAYAIKTYYPEMDTDAELLIEIKDEHGLEEVMPILINEGLQIKRAFYPADSTNTLLDNYYTLDIPRKKMHKLKSIKRKLRGNKGIEHMEMNEVFRRELPEKIQDFKYPAGTIGVTNDALSASQWSLQFLELPSANVQLQNRGRQIQKKTLVAILDTGIDANHEDIKSNYSFFSAKDEDDPQGHGTHCGGIIGAVSNNRLGISGISFSNEHLSIRSYKVLGANGLGSQQTIIEGIIRATDDGAGVISLSLGGFSRDSKQRAFEKAIKYANDRGTVVVVAAGNNSADARNYAPANAKGAITVTAVDSTGKLASFSNKAAKLEQKLAAPGVDILSTYPKNQYKQLSGTSMATPHVAGIVAIMKSLRPELTSVEIYKILEETGRSGPDSRQSGKIPLLGKALERL